MPYMPLDDELLELAEVEEQAAIAQLTVDVINGDDDANGGDIQASIEPHRPAGGDVAETPATVKSVGRRKTPASAKMTPASARSVEAKVASASRPQRGTPDRESNIANGTAATASTSRKRASTGPLSSRASKKTKVVEDNEDEYEVEAIVDDGVDDDTLEHMYEVKWKGYDDTTWEPLKNLTHCKDLIAAYENKKPTTRRNASSVRGRGPARARGAGMTRAAKAATGKPATKPTANKSSRGRGRGRGKSTNTTRAPKVDATKVAAEKITAAKRAADNKARAARAASKRTAANASTAKKPRGGKATRGGRGRPRRSA